MPTWLPVSPFPRFACLRLLLFVCSVCSVVPLQAAPKDGVGLSKISLPSGPGSIEGLGDSFEPQLNSGTSAYSIKVAIPPGVNGLQPDVVLHYNAGSGNGPFGLAWSWSPMTIQRLTEKGLPTYTATDVFTHQVEELVPLSDGSYRCKNEFGFMRFTRSGDGWEVRDKSGKVYRLGTVAESRQMKPGGTGFSSTFKWYVNEVVDTHGNRMEYHYSTYADSPGQIYCTEIRYSISRTDPGVFHSVVFDYETRADVFSSFISAFEVRTARRCREIRVLSQGAVVRRYVLGYAADPSDPIEPVSATDAGLSFSFIRKVTQFDNGSTASSSYLPPLRLAYTRLDATNGVRGVLTNLPPLSLGNPNASLADINCDALPDLFYTDPFTGQHTVFYNLGGNRFSGPTNFLWQPDAFTLDVPETQLADFDGDGRVDLVRKYGEAYDYFVYFPNTTQPFGNDDAHPVWGPEHSFATPFPPITLDDPSVRTLDLDGDKRMDFMRTTSAGFVYYYNRTNQWIQDGLHLFGEAVMGDLTAADGVQFSTIAGDGSSAPNNLVKLADMNGDRLLDLVKLTVFNTSLQITFWPNQGRGAWGTRRFMQGSIDLGVIPVDDVFLMDLNGDGLADVVAVGYDYFRYWINQGNGNFSSMFMRTGLPLYVRGTTVLRQADINGNGSTDFLWENWNPATGTFKVEFYDFLGITKPNLLTTIDNGIGLRTLIEYKTTTDYYVAARQAGHPWHTRLPSPSSVVSKITRQIGLDLDGAPGNDEYVTEFSYFDGYYDAFEKQFRGFAFAKKVERGDERYPGVTVNSPATVTRFAFHTGAPDATDNNGDGQVDEFNPINGYEEEPLKGKVLWTEMTLPTADVGGSYPAQTDGQLASDAVVFTRETNLWKIKLIHTPTNGFTYRDAFGVPQPALSLPYNTTVGKRVAFAYIAAHGKQVIDANGALAGTDPFIPIRARKILFSESDVDFFGNSIIERNYGENSPGSTFDDERFAYHTYAFNLDAWLIGLPASSRVTDEHGNFVSESRSYYDGSAFSGLPLGQVGLLGDMVRQEQFVNGSAAVPAFSVITNRVGDPRLSANAAINVTRSQYDLYGNLVTVRDPLYTSAGQGHEKEYGYDPTFHTYVGRETIHVGNGSADLVAQASYDTGAGVMTGFTDFNGNSTSLQYDSFWRLVGIVKPGDSAAFPTAAFSYRPGDPFRHLYFNYDSAGQLSLAPTADTDIANAVTTHQREQAGTNSTFDTVSFTDGAGHKLGTLHENDVAGQWVAKDFKRFTSQGEERLALLPFVTGSSKYAVPPESQPHVTSFYDSASRVIRTVNPPETTNANAAVTEPRTVYLPLEAILFDEEQANPASPRFNLPHVQLKDGLDRLIGVIETARLNDDGTPAGTANQWLTRYEYDLNDNLTHITDSQGNQKWFRYDGLKRKLFMNDPDRGTMTYSYDDGSNLRQTVDAKAQVIAYTYDGVNRLKTENYLDGLPLPSWRSSRGNEALTNSVVYHYDTPITDLPQGDGTTSTATNTKGMLAWVEDLSGEEHTSYDSRGRVQWVVKALPDPQNQSLLTSAATLVSYRTGFTYDSLDRVTALTYPDNDQVGYTYSPRNLLQNIVGGPSGYILSSILYRPSDQLAQIDYGNGVRTTYDYDPRLRLTRLHTLSASGGEGQGEVDLISFAYDFDGVSNIKAIRDQRPGSAVPAGDPRRNTQVFAYDSLYRLTQASYNPGSPGTNTGVINYRYDRIGNMLAQTSTITHDEKGLPVANLGDMDSGGASGRANRVGRQPADPPGPHALTAIRHSSLATRNYPYDANGNMLIIDGLTNTWDFKDRLIRVEDTNMVAAYSYDYTDRRVMKSVWPRHPLPSDGRGAGGEGTSVLYVDKYFEVREHDAPVKYIWNGNTRVARASGNLASNVRVQRLRVHRGMNMATLAVTAANAMNQFQNDRNSPIPITAWKLNPTTQAWLPVASGETLPAGTVLWLRAATNATLTVVGAYNPPAATSIPAGVSVVSNPTFDPLPVSAFSLQPSAFSLWSFDSAAQTWNASIPELSTLNSQPSTSLAPGDALFVRTDTGATNAGPDTTLTVRYYHQDHLGSSSVMTDAAGQLVEETVNYPFGHPRQQFQSRGIRENYQFTQKEMDAESGLDYFEARYLSAGAGRFMSVDPITCQSKKDRLRGPQQENGYSYCENRPLTLLDPSGCEGKEPQAPVPCPTPAPPWKTDGSSDPELPRMCVDVTFKGSFNFGLKRAFSKNYSLETSWGGGQGQGTFEFCSGGGEKDTFKPTSVGGQVFLGGKFGVKGASYGFTGKFGLGGSWDSDKGFDGGLVYGVKLTRGNIAEDISGNLEDPYMGRSPKTQLQVCFDLLKNKNSVPLPFVGSGYGDATLCFGNARLQSDKPVGEGYRLPRP
jgi:RHS repeat-associated protein